MDHIHKTACAAKSPGQPDRGQPVDQDGLLRLSQAIGHTFTELAWIKQALTHSTYAYEHRNQKIMDNERLEFLGDAILDLAISDALFLQKENFAEGYMTKTRAMVVCENTLALVAKELSVGQLLLLGRGEESTGGRDKPSNLANTMEAIFGAIYLDAGYDQAKQVILRLLEPFLMQAMRGEMVYDYKSKLLELVQGTRGNSTVKFMIISEEGPVHDRTFTSAVLVDDLQIAVGKGSSKKEAEQQAARVALNHLDCDRQGCVVAPGLADGSDL